MKQISTLQVNKETQQLIRQYCFLHKMEMKDFIEKITHERLSSFKKKLDELKKLNI